MSKKRVNFGSIATSEAARRELMKPVTCWEKAWVTPEGSKVRVRQWVQTNKNPEWSDDEADNIDQPLAPILDVEVVDMDEDEEGAEAGETAEATSAPESQAAPANGAAVPPPDSLDVPPEASTTELSLSTPQEDVVETELTLDPGLSNAETADLTGADLTGADLTGADLTGADLTGADLTAADLTAADLAAADLAAADLAGTDLAGADLTGADLAGADLTAADLTGDMDFSALTADPMDMLPPDGTAFEAVHDLSQIEEGDDLLGGKVMDESADPFASVS